MREDIYGGLKNALERGVPLEIAITSFVNAGYKESDVRAVARDVQAGVFPLTQAATAAQMTKPVTQLPQPSQQPRPISTMAPKPQQVTQNMPASMSSRQPQSMSMPPQKSPQPSPQQVVSQPIQETLPRTQTVMQRPSYVRRKPDFIIILLAVLLALSVLGFIASLIFKDQIATFLKALF